MNLKFICGQFPKSIPFIHVLITFCSTKIPAGLKSRLHFFAPILQHIKARLMSVDSANISRSYFSFEVQSKKYSTTADSLFSIHFHRLMPLLFILNPCAWHFYVSFPGHLVQNGPRDGHLKIMKKFFFQEMKCFKILN